jgi:predicted ATPase
MRGEPGIGKSSLLASTLADARGQGCHLFFWAADEIRRAFPLAVLLDCLNDRFGGPDAAAGQIADLLRGIVTASVATPADAMAMAAELLLEEVERLWAVSPVVLVADVLQGEDYLSLSVWRRLHGLVRQLPLMLVGACRPVPFRAEVAALRRALLDEQAVLVAVGPLSPPHVPEMVAGLVGARPGPQLLAQAEMASGNPLYIRELVDALVRERAIQMESGTAELVDPSRGKARPMASAITARLSFLSAGALEVLRVAVLFGTGFSVEDLTIVTGKPATELAPAIDEAIAAGVVAEAGARLAFRHGLIRHALYEQMPVSLWSALHRQAAETLAGAACRWSE